MREEEKGRDKGRERERERGREEGREGGREKGERRKPRRKPFFERGWFHRERRMRLKVGFYFVMMKLFLPVF